MEILNSNINVVVQPHRKTPCLDFDFKEMNFHFYNSAEQKQCAIKGLCHATACVVQTPTALLHWWNDFFCLFVVFWCFFQFIQFRFFQKFSVDMSISRNKRLHMRHIKGTYQVFLCVSALHDSVRLQTTRRDVRLVFD